MSRIRPILKKLRQTLIQLVVELARFIGAKTLRLGGPIDVFSIFDNSTAVSLVLKGQTSIPAQPGSLRDICGFAQDKQQPWPIFWAHIPLARLAGESLAVLNNQKKMMVENLYGPNYYRTDPNYNYLSLPAATHLEGPWTSILGRFCRSGRCTFFHWMTDGLPRLALLDRFPSDTRILIPEPLLPSQRESLEILGVLDRCRPTTEKHLLVDDYYFSSFTAMTGCDNPYAIQFLRERFLPAAAPITLNSDKIYIARRGAARTPIQEGKMIEFLQGEGWAIIQGEKYTFREQIGLFRKARAVCSIHGAGLSHLLWCNKGCKVLELSATNYLNGATESLAVCLGLDHRFMLFPADSKFRISVDMTKFKSAIAALD